METELKFGAGRDGTIHVLEGKVIADAGPYSGRSPGVLGLTMSALVGPYRIPNVLTRAEGICTNNLDLGAFRGFGAPQAAIAGSVVLDKLARALAIDLWNCGARTSAAGRPTSESDARRQPGVVRTADRADC